MFLQLALHTPFRLVYRRAKNCWHATEFNSGLVSSIIRFTIFFQNEAFVDGTWASVNLMTWTLIEPGIYIIAACLPNLRALWLPCKDKIPSFWWSHASTSTTSSSSKRPKYIELGMRNNIDRTTKPSASSREVWEGYHSGPRSDRSIT